jgi:5'-deoxynucleotidase YfbR-like HD superfamily hydrolase
MMKLNVDTMRQLYQMDNIIRYNTTPRHKNETVATHSYYVALFSMMLCNELNVSSLVRSKAIAIALVHDIPEVIINDVTYEAKQHMPDVKAALEKYEQEVIKANFPELYKNMYDSYFVDDDIANQIVRLADVLSVLQFSDHEINMGNTYLKGWDKDTQQRIEEIKNNLERMGLKCQNLNV